MLSIIIPVYNEESSIGDVLDGAMNALKDIKHEIIVVDDGSQDRTAEIARAKGVKVLSHPENAGYGTSIKTGIKASKYDYIGIVDGDGSYPVKDFPKMVEFMKDYDMVVGARRGKHYWGSVVQHPSRLFFLWWVRYVTGTAIPDANSGMRLFKKDTVLSFMDPLSKGFSFTTSLTLVMTLRGKFVKYVSIDYYKRRGKSKVKWYKYPLRSFQILLETVIYYNPIKLIIPICLFTGLASIILWVCYFIFWGPLLAWLASITGFLTVEGFLIGLIVIQNSMRYRTQGESK